MALKSGMFFKDAGSIRREESKSAGRLHPSGLTARERLPIS